MKAYKRALLTGVCMLWFCFRVMPQLCPNSALAPVFSQDFGQGITALSTTAAVSGSTNYVFGGVGTDGNYVLTPSFDVSGKSDWTKLGDHTGNTFGNMFLVNAGGGKSIFFKQTVNGLCSGSTFNFSAWLANANTSSTIGVCGAGYKYPNVIFNIKNTSGTVLATYNTGNLPLSPVNGPANWQQYGFQFTLPVGTTSLVLEMVDYWGGAAACGNDLALDDILFTACTPQVTVSLSTGATPICSGSSPTIATSLVNSPFTAPAYQWQKSTDNGVTWNNIGTPGTSANDFSFANISATDGGIYRVLVGPDVASLSSSSCITASSPITVTVNTRPTVTVSNNGPVCSGNTLTLTPAVTGGTSPFSYTWSGPNSFSSISATPSIATVATAASGTYSLTLTDAQGCVASASSTLTVNATPVVNAISGTSGGCAGTTVTLSNTTPAGVWSSNNTPVATITNAGVVSLVSGGSTVISYSVTSSGCSAAATKTITTASVHLQNDIIACTSGLIQFDQAPFTPAYSASLGTDSYAWSMSSTTGTVTYDPGSTPASQYPHVQLSNGAIYTIALRYTTSGITCSDTQIIYKNIIAADTIQTSHDTTICNSTALISLVGTASAVVNSFTWTSSGTGLFSNPSGLQTNYTPSIADKAAGNIKIYLIASTNLGTTGSCPPGATAIDSMILRITPPNTGTPTVQTICSGQSLSFTPASSISGSTFSWSSAITTGTATGNAVSGTGNITDVLVNPSASNNAIVTYTITPSSALPGGGSCGGTPFTFTVTVSPVASINAITATSCSGLAFAVTPVNGINGTVPAGTTYTWLTPTGTGFTGGSSQAAATGYISGTLLNTTNASLTATYVVTPQSGICAGAAFTITVTVTPVNMINAMTATTCSGSAFSITPVNGINGIVLPGTIYSWSAPAVTGGITGGAAGTNATNISGVLNHTLITSQTATYTVTPQSGICAGAPFTVTVTLNPVAAIASLSTTICTGSTFSVTPVNGSNGIIPTGTTYSWSTPSLTAGLTGGASAANAGAIAGTLINTTNTSQTATYTVLPASGSCTGSSFTVIVTVNPVAVINPMTAVVCSGTAFSVTPTNSVNGITPAATTYSWGTPSLTVGLTGGNNAGTSTNISGTLINTGNTAQTATYVVTPSTGVCTGSSFTVTVTVNPVAAINSLTATICSGAAFSVTPTDIVNGMIPAGSVFNWTAPLVTGGLTGGVGVTNATNIAGTLTNPSNAAQTATYAVTPVSGNCTGSTFTVTVMVNPVSAINTMTTALCSGTAFTLTPADITNGVVPAGTMYSWAVPSITGGLTGGTSATNTTSVFGTLNNPTNTTQTATYTVTPLSGSCTGSSFTIIITVDPVAVIHPMSGVICSGTVFTLTPADSTDGIIPAGTTYSWGTPSATGGLTGGTGMSNTTSITGSLINPTNTTQTATYVVSAASGICAGNTFTVTVTAHPVAVISAMSTSICSGATFSLTPTNITNGIIPAGTIYSWTTPSATGGLTGGTSAANTTAITGVLINTTNALQTATYLVTPVTGSCNGTSFSITVSVNPVAIINTMTAVTCGGSLFTVTPTDIVNGTIPSGTYYSWNTPSVTGGVTGGSAGVNATNIGGILNNTTNTTQTATYFVSPVSGTCTGTSFTVTITVNPVAVINGMTAIICSGTSFAVTPTNVMVPIGTTYSWSAPTVSGGVTGGAGAANAAFIAGALTNPTNTTQTATYFITPVSGICTGALFTATITIDPVAVVNGITTVVCSGTLFSVTPTNGIHGMIPAGTTYSWITPAVTGGVTGGSAAANATGIAGILNNPTNIAQTATYTLTAVSGACAGSSFTVTVTVNPIAVVNAMAAATCSGTAFTLSPINTVNGIIPAGATYSWAAPTVTGGLSSGSAATSLTAISGSLINTTNSVQTATYTIIPVAGSCLSSSFTITITVNPVAAINPLTAITCSGVSFTLTPTNADGIVPTGTNYSWLTPSVTGGLTGGANGTNAANISGTFSNTTNTSQTATYSVTTLSGACSGNTFTVTIGVNPIAAVNQMTAIVCSGSAFVVTPTHGINGIIPAATTYSWASPSLTTGLTGGSAATNTANIYGTLINTTNTAQTATYSVTAVSGTCSGNVFTVTVTVDAVAVVNQMTAVICSGTGFVLSPTNIITGVIPAGTTYSWATPSITAGLTGLSTTTNAANIYGTLINTTNTAQTASYSVTPVAGSCPGNVFTVTVTVDPVASINLMTWVTCSGTAFNLTPANITNGIIPLGTTYSWATPAITGSLAGGSGATNVTGITGMLINTSNIPQTATYVVTPVSGACAGNAFTITVTVNPVAAINTMTAILCSGTAFSLTPANSTNGIVPAGTTYSWNTPSVTGGLTGSISATGATNISGTFSNTTNTSQTATYTITPVNGSCSGTSFTVIVTIDPVAVVNAMSAIICSGTVFTLTPTDVTNGIIPTGTNYTWNTPSATGGVTGGVSAANVSIVTGAFTNPTNTAQTATYFVTPVSGICTGNSFTVTVTVTAVALVNTMSAIACSGASFSITPTNSIHGVIPAGTNYSWSAPAVTGGLVGASGATNTFNIAGTLHNPTNTAQTAAYLVTPVSGTCTGNPFTVTISVNPIAVINPMTVIVCSGSAFVVTPTNGINGIIPAATNYNWAAPSLTTGLTGGSAATNTANIYGTFINTTNASKTATYLVTPVSGVCAGNIFTVTITVDPVAVVNQMTTVICSGTAFVLTPTNIINGVVPTGTTYGWTTPSITAGLTGLSTATNTANIYGTLINTTNTAQTATYTVTPVTGFCMGNSFTITVTVSPLAAINALTAVTCSGTAFTITPTNVVNGIIPAGTNYSWSTPSVTGGLTGGTSATNTTNIAGVLSNPVNTTQTATYSVTPLSGVCAGNPFTVTVSVNPVAAINSMTAVICSGTSFTVTPTNTINGIIPAGTTYSWSTPSVTGGLTGSTVATNTTNISGTLNNPTNTTQTATYTVTPLVGICSGAPFTITVTVNPVAAINAMTAVICSGTSFSITPTNIVNGIIPAGTLYSWSTPSVTGGLTGAAGANNTTYVSGTFNNPTNTTQTATYTVTPVAGVCTGISFTVSVSVNPAALINPMTTIICSGTSFSITPTNLVNGIIPAGTLYSWSIPSVTGGLTGTAGATNTTYVSGTFNNPTNTTQTATYTVTPVSGICTGQSFTVSVTVSPTAVITPITAAVCSGAAFTVTPTHTTNGIVPAATTYSWSIPSVSSGLTGAASATNSTSIQATFINTTNTTQTATYTITPIAGNCTGNPFTVTVTVRPLPKAEMTIVKNIGCTPFTVDNSIISPVLYPGTNASYEWYVDNALTGSGSSFPLFVLSTDSAVIKLTVTSLYNCGTNSATSVIKIYASPKPSFTVSDSTGCGPLSINIVNTTPDLSAYQYAWDLGNGQHSTLAQPGSIIYPASVLGNDTVYTITLKSYQYCDTFSIAKQITVSRKAKLDFTAALQNNCSPLKVIFTNQSAGKQVQYHISYGDGVDSITATNTQYLHTYYAGTQTTYRALLTASNACGIDSMAAAITTLPNVVTIHLALSDSVVCGNPFALTINNQTDSANGFTWDFGDGSPMQTTASKSNVQHTYQAAGTYQITNGIAGKCSDTVIYRKLVVYPSVKAVANTLPQNNCIGTAISFKNLSDTGLSSKWIFGDGGVSDSSLAVHYFAQAGTYAAKLGVWKTHTEITCTDTSYQPVTIVATKQGRFTLSDSIGKCLPFAVSFINQNKPAQTKWSWGDGQVSSGDSATHSFTSNGSFTVSMQSIQAGGCSYVDTAVVRITAPEIALQYQGGAYCQQNNSIEFTAVTTRTDSIRWEFGDGITMMSAGSQKVAHTYSRAGSFIPKLTLMNTDNCNVPVMAQDSIHIDEINAGFKLLAINDCAKTDYRFTDTSRSFFPIVKRLWTMNQHQASSLGRATLEGNEKEISQVYTKAGEYDAALQVQNQIGCKATLDAKFNVSVYEFPKANINSINDACLYNLMEIKSLVVSQDSVIRRIWNLGNGAAATDSVVKIYYAKEGTYTLSLTVGTINSCYDSVYKQLSIHPIPTLVLATDRNVCKGDSIQLKASGAMGYIWKDQNDNILCNNCNELKVVPQKNAQYKVIGYNEFGCSNISSTNIRVIQPFKLALLASDSMCEGSSRRIIADGADNYTWFPTPGLSNYTSAVTYATPAVTTTYKVVGKDGYNCFADTASIKLVIGKPTPVNVGRDTTIIAGVPIQLNKGTLSPDIRQWQWGGKADYSCVYCASPVVKVIDDGPLTVKATNQFGCVTTDTVHVKTFCSGAEVFIPNAFTPDGDGVNDVLILQGRGIKIVKSLRIYSRWGEMVYEKTNFQPGDRSAGWDGKVRGKLANPDVFVYLCEAVCEKGAAYTLKGNVAIIK